MDNESMLKSAHSFGFTLIELLITISIMAILSTIAFVNFKDFAQEEVSNRAVGQVQTSFREAQSNASANVLCGNQAGVNWAVNFQTDKTTVNLACGTNNITQKSLHLENVQVTSIDGDSPNCSSVSLPLIITFAPLSSQITMTGSDDCIARSKTVTLTLTNTKTSAPKTISISKGGAIDVQ